MKRFPRSLRLLALSLATLALPLASCRSPVQGRPGASLSLSLSVPAGLSSPLPEALRQAVGEAELAGARPRFLHPDGRVVKVVATKADGSEVGGVAIALPEGGTGASIAVDDLPLGVPLTLTVGVYDAVDAKVGEGSIELEPLTGTPSDEPRSVSVLPYGATALALGEAPTPLGGLAEGKLGVYSISLTEKGLYQAIVLVDGEYPPAAMAELYTQEGLKHQGFAADPSNALRYGLFGKDTPEAAPFYLLVTGPAAGSALTISSRKLSHDLPVFGSTSFDEPGSIVLLSPDDPASTVEDVYAGYIYLPGTNTMSFELYNPYPSELTIKAFAVSTVEGDDAFFPPAPPVQPLSPGGGETFVMTFTPSTLDQYKARLVIDLEDEDLNDFSMAFYGSASY